MQQQSTPKVNLFSQSAAQNLSQPAQQKQQQQDSSSSHESDSEDELHYHENPRKLMPSLLQQKSNKPIRVALYVGKNYEP